jgi:hypothetical protein
MRKFDFLFYQCGGVGIKGEGAVFFKHFYDILRELYGDCQMAMVLIVKPYGHKMKHPVIHSSKGKKYKKYKVPFNQGNIPER